jgi:Tol biopolymer transport system component
MILNACRARCAIGVSLPLLLSLAGCNAEPAKPGDLAGRIAFVRGFGPTAKIHIMRPDGSDVRQLTLSGDGEDYPAWSPDGRMIAFRRIFDTLGIQGVGIYAMRDDGSQLTEVFSARVEDCSGNTCRPIWYGDPNHPTWSPDGTRLAFQSQHEGFLVPGPPTNRWYYPTRIYTVKLDGSEITPTNPVVDSLMLADWYPAWSPDGSNIAFASLRAFSWVHAPGANDDIYLMSGDGTRVTRLTDSPVEETWPAWSPDGRRLAFERKFIGGTDIYMMNADGSGIVQLTHGPAHNFHPSWSPDGTRIAFASNRDGNWEIYVIDADGSGLTRLTNDPRDDLTPAWSPKNTGR